MKNVFLGRLGLPMAFAAALTAAPPVRAGIPSAEMSSVDPVLAFCPAGDLSFSVIVRRISSSPMLGSGVWLDFCNASGWRIDPWAQPTDVAMISGGCATRLYSDVTGTASFALKAGGLTAPNAVGVYADGVLFGFRTLVSPDQNGDLRVDASDESLLAAKIGSADPSGDLDGDGAVTAADRALLRLHLGHSETQATAAAAGTWGRLKTMYR